MSLTILRPSDMPRPSGYSYGVGARGGMTLYIAGQIAWDAERRMVGVGDIVRQFEQTQTMLKRFGRGMRGMKLPTGLFR